LGELFRTQQQPAKAEKAFRQALAAREKHVQARPHEPDNKRELAWLLATCPDAKVRDPARAIEVAKQAVDQAWAKVDREAVGRAEKTLGVAYFRAGDWKNALELLDRARVKIPVDNQVIGFLKAMTYWHLGDHKNARQLFDMAARGMDQMQD